MMSATTSARMRNFSLYSLSKRDWILIGILIVALVPRLFSVHWNSIPHGDVEVDVQASASFLRDGTFTLPPSDEIPSSDAPLSASTTHLIQHPPLWPLLGAVLTRGMGLSPSPQNIFFAFKILSLFSGLVLILLAERVGRKLISETAGLVMAGWIAVSTIMIDFSGNGSFYSLHAALYLLWILIAFRRDDWMRAISLGVVTGVAYMINFQSILLLPASVIVLLWKRKESWSQRIGYAAVATGIVVAIALPWCIRNAVLFGDPFYSHYANNIYVFIKSGVPLSTKNGQPYYDLQLSNWLDILFNGVIRVWLPNNLYYIARKLFILAPIAFFLFSFAWIDYLFSKERIRKIAPLLLLLILHLLISSAWPVTKFRYFVPMLPLVFLIALEHLYAQKWTENTRKFLISITFISLIVLTFLTWRAIPTHTMYYDGAITNDPFHGSQEMDFVREHYPELFPKPQS